MSDLPHFPGAPDESERGEPARGAGSGIPPWLVFIAIVILVIGLVVMAHVTGLMPKGIHGGGGHGI